MSVAYTINDLQELEKLILEVKNEQLKQILEHDARIWRSRLVTHLVNSDLADKMAPQDKKNNSTVSQVKDIEQQLAKLEKPAEPAKLQLKKPTKKDEDAYMLKQLKGSKEKIRSMQATLGSDFTIDQIGDALIRCKGREEDAIEGLFSGELPKRPAIPQAFYAEFDQEQTKKHEEATANYKAKLQEYEKIKKDLEAQKQQASAAEKATPSASASAASSGVQLLVDITEPEHQNNVNALSERAKVLRAEIQKKKQEADKLQKEVNKLKEKNGVVAAAAASASKGNNDNNEDGNTRLYLPGEYEAIQNNEPRIFTFKPERTFSNEVSHIHFRVAESEFYRLMQVKNQFRVAEVKYIVTPHLINKFESKRAQIAFEMGKKYKEVKPILTYLQHTDDEVDWIQLNNFKESDSGYYCSNDPAVASPAITKAGRFILCLVIPGKSARSETVAKAKQTAGCHSTVSSDGLHVKVYELDQILPYYIVKFEVPNAQQNAAVFNSSNPNVNPQLQHLDKEWENLEQNAKADKFMSDCQTIFIEALSKKDKERKMGEINPNNDAWFEQIYKKRYEKEKQFMITGDELASPSGVVDDGSFDIEDEMNTPTPTSAINDKSPHFPEEDD